MRYHRDPKVHGLSIRWFIAAVIGCYGLIFAIATLAYIVANQATDCPL